MDPSKEDDTKGNVKVLISKFIDIESSGTSAGSKDRGQRSKTSRSTDCLSVKSDHSIESPLLFKGKQLETSRSSECLSVKSENSMEPPLLFKGKHGKKPESICASENSTKNIPPYFSGKHGKKPESICASENSTKNIPPYFSGKHGEKPESLCASENSTKNIPPYFKGERMDGLDNYSTCRTDIDDLSSKDITPHSDIKVGMPKYWSRPVIGMGPQTFKVHCPPSAVYPELTAHTAPHDFVHTRVKMVHSSESQEMDFPSYPNHHYRERADSRFSSDTFDCSSASGSRDFHYDGRTLFSDEIAKEVLCEICNEATAVKTCLTCNVSLCDYDVRQHYVVKSLERHKLIDVCYEVEEKRCLHYKKALDFFCRTDRMQICSICAQRNHRGHDIVSQRPGAKSPMSDGDEYQKPGLLETVVPPPGEIEFLSVKPNSVVLRWGCPEGLEGPNTFRVKWSSPTAKVEDCSVIKDLTKIEITKLKLGQKYIFSVATEDKEGNLSEWIHGSVFTAVPAPRDLTQGHSEARALSVRWTKGDNMEEIPHQFLVKVTSLGKEPLAVIMEDCYKIFTDLEPDTKYTVSVSTVFNNRCSEEVSISVHTGPCLREVLSKIGLEDQFDNELTLSTVLEINQKDTSDNELETAKSLPEAFLKKLMLLNANARCVPCLSSDEDTDNRYAINPLDLIIVLFFCSDSFLQQNIVLKMALCQFAIPLLLPDHETREITLMLWSMREIVRTFKPSNQAFSKLSCEERLVLSDIPLVSFVRLRKTISKSQILNKLLSNTQPCHDTFCHRDMVSGDVPRRISDGLVEISWYLPCGNKGIDKFTEPLAVANLRGDIRAFDKQFLFLCQTSAVVYIFCDESEVDYFMNLERKNVKANIILISSVQGKTFTLKTMTLKPSLKITNASKTKKSDTELIKALQESISKMLENCTNKVSVEDLAGRARCCEILVDEDSDECQSAWKNAGKITAQVTNISEFKEKQLTSQGNIWKAISWLETEYWRLRKAANRNTEDYRKSLKTKEKELKRKQLRFEKTAAMSNFLHGLVTSEVQRNYFLKWLETDLDNLSRNKLSALQDQYREQSQKFPQDTEKIAEIDKQISACSLRLEHFFRECGQLYECASSLPDYSRQRQTVEQLPALCAQMLLDGFPLELVDGDAANIPVKWITKVLTELHDIMQSNSKLKVITIIGAENSGKSSLLNTMFGSRFTIGKGTCTRGAFIQLINVNKDVREELGCDCIMIIDTEGLKPYQMVQDDHSHERDKEVASLAVALSDVTVVSISSDISSEKDVLEMVLHAFTRLKDVGTKPLCHFVHSNKSDVPAVKRKNGKEWVVMLNDIIRKDSGMKKAKITKISDVMEFDPDTCSWHIPSIWHGTPPMAPISVDYSETAHALKKRLIGDLKKCRDRGDLTNFIGWVKNFWEAL